MAIEVELYLIGDDAEDAEQYFPYDSAESARKDADNMGMKVFKVTAHLDFSTIEEEVYDHGTLRNS